MPQSTPQGTAKQLSNSLLSLPVTHFRDDLSFDEPAYQGNIAWLKALGDASVGRAHAESGLSLARLTGERGRNTGQLYLFATLLRDGNLAEIPRVDPAQPDRTPPRADIRERDVPLGPVAVYGVGNFPLAVSVAGGDIASADPRIRAAGFTGSRQGGLAVVAAAQARSRPISRCSKQPAAERDRRRLSNGLFRRIDGVPGTQ